MSERRLKYFFLIFSALLLGFMLYLSSRAGVSCDEVLHYTHSEYVYNYFASLGKDQTALNTPVTHLQYYGQSYDNLVTILIKWFGIDDIYGFRHIMSALAGWLTVVITALFAVWLAGYGAGIIVLILFAVSPTFLGHAQNNLKDIPFALGYIAGVFFTLKFLIDENRKSFRDYLFLIISISFCLSIRAGGLLLICYLFLFFFILKIISYFQKRQIDFRETGRMLVILAGISIAAYFLSTLLWPYALQNPILNPLRSYRVMVQYPDTFRQIFEGKVEWSDYMPWRYLPEYMAITIPIILITGLVLFFVFSKTIFKSGKTFAFLCLLFSILFPVVFVIWEKSNLYSAWRHFLFIYPGIVLISSIGFFQLFKIIRRKTLVLAAALLLAVLSYNPLKFIISNPAYTYLYYNQFVGGLKGAYGRYETDYYFVSLQEASEWLLKYIEEKKISTPVKVEANFSVNWFFRKHPEIKTGYFRFEERSQNDWDYAIIVNRYIPPFQLLNKTWPPDNAIKVINADGVPVCAILERKSKDDYNGYIALNEGRTSEAINFFTKAIQNNNKDEMIYYNFASALMDSGEPGKADSLLKKCLEVNPEFDLALMYLGNIAVVQNKPDEAVKYYKHVIEVNRKYFDAYVELSKLICSKDIKKARELLRDCLDIDPQFKPAIIALANTYRSTNPDIAKKYDELAKTIK